MKKLILILITTLIFVSLYFFLNEKDKKDEEILTNKIINKDIKKIAFISDTHLQLDKRGYSVNGLNEFNDTIIDALLEDVSKSDIDLLVLVGDNTNSGKIDQHKELIKKLNKYNSDFDILVTIGNHDQGQLELNEFEKLYKDFGLSSYFSKESSSLSYSTIYNDLMIIILDTGGHDESGIDPSLNKSTLNWFEKELSYSKDNNLKVVCVGHHPILTEQSGEFKQKDLIKDLLIKYDVSLYVCGHLHGHNVNKYDDLFELVVEQSTSYPISYEVLSIMDNSFNIESKIVDIEKYARENNLKDNNLLEFNSLLEYLFKAKSDEIVDLLAQDKNVESEKLILAKEMFYIVMRQRSLGDLVDYVDIINFHPGKEIFLNISKGTIWHDWLPKVLNGANVYTKGFNIKIK